MKQQTSSGWIQTQITIMYNKLAQSDNKRSIIWNMIICTCVWNYEWMHTRYENEWMKSNEKERNYIKQTTPKLNT